MNFGPSPRALALALCLTALACGRASAQLHAGDILLVQAQTQTGTQILTGQVDSLSAQPLYGVRVFEAAFVDAPNFTSNPGLDSDIGAFPPSSQIGFTIRKALRKWDGS